MEWKLEGRWAIGSLIIVSGFILFFNLWARSLETHGYIRYAEVAREMIRSGEWVVPRLNGEVFTDKPPLLFWLIALSSSLYGSVTPLIARLPSFFSAWIGIIILFLWGKRVYGTAQSGLIAGGVLLSSYQYFFQARLAKTDMLLCLFILLSLYFFFLGYDELRKRRYLFYGISFFCMGLGVMTKGPFGLLPPFFILSIYLIKERQWGLLISKEFILGYVILALVILPWVFLFIHRIGLDQAITLMRENQILTRKAPIYFYFYQIWAEFFPWSVLFPFLGVYLWRRKGEFWHAGESFFLIWFIVFFIILTLFKFRASRYLLPTLPPLALMMGGMWKKRFSFFLIPFFLFVLIWHSVEVYWIGEDLSHSHGMVLTEELRPFLKESTLFGYRLDSSTLEEINFYMDPLTPIPTLKGVEKLSNQLRKEEKGSILMPKDAYEEIRSRGDLSMVFVREFLYKGTRGRLVLVSN